ncbi:MAG: multicopper oxidase domain-containing protein [Deltaproteobacteria bacterium]|nr:multicopper oxidase domain-containing protein [Deltaproteobacteria bacterium]
MRWTPSRKIGMGVLCVLASALFFAVPAGAEIPGLTGTSFSLVAASDYIQNGDGNNLFFWGYADGNPPSGTVSVQYPGPTLIVNEGDTVTVTLRNWLPDPVSLLFPGMDSVTATPSDNNGIRGIFTWEAPPGGQSTVTYTFVAGRPGTFYYQSGTNMDKQLEMGLFGAIIVRPAVFNPAAPTAYGESSSAYTAGREFLFILSEMDDRYHNQVERGEEIDTTTFFPVYWFINGRNSPDTMGAAGASYLPHQPYNALPMMHPGEKSLIRLISMGRDQHPFHPHSNHTRVIAWDAMPLTSDPADFANVGADLGELAFTVTTVPGRTSDSTFEWTGKALGWDVYGDPNDPLTAHDCAPNAQGFDPVTSEWCADHGKPFPVGIPEQDDLSAGDFFSGSPFLGQLGALPPGFGKFNTNGAFFQIWHSHSEKEMTNNDVFPGGIMTFMVIIPPGVDIP